MCRSIEVEKEEFQVLFTHHLPFCFLLYRCGLYCHLRKVFNSSPECFLAFISLNQVKTVTSVIESWFYCIEVSLVSLPSLNVYCSS